MKTEVSSACSAVATSAMGNVAKNTVFFIINICFLTSVLQNCLLSPLQEVMLNECVTIASFKTESISATWIAAKTHNRLPAVPWGVLSCNETSTSYATFNVDLHFLWVCAKAFVALLPSEMACQHFDERSFRELVWRLKLARVQKKPSLCAVSLELNKYLFFKKIYIYTQ